MYKYISIILLFLHSFVFSQDCNLNGNIEETFFNEDVIGIYLTAIDFDSGQSNFLLFDYAINNISYDATCEYENSGNADVSFLLDFDISMFIDTYHDSPQDIANGTIRINDLPITNPIQEIRFRNTDLNFDTTTLDGNTKFELLSSEISIMDDEQDEISELFLSSGRVPNGLYSFNFTLKACDEYNSPENGAGCDEIGQISKHINIYIPTFIELLSPGSNSLSDTLNTQISNTYPVFQWNSDYCSNCNFSIRVSQYKPEIHSSLQEALEDYSVLPSETGYYLLDDGLNVFQYPTSGYENLFEGNYYVWQLQRSYETSNGTNNDYSQIFIFKIQSLIDEDLHAETDLNNFNLENIKLIIGTPKFNQLFGEYGDLFEFNDVDNIISVNGEEYPSDYLIEMIEKINQNLINVIEVNVE